MLRGLVKKKPSPAMIIALLALFFSLTGTAAAAVNYALNADKVDGRHAVKASAAVLKGKLVATNATTGLLPAAVVGTSGVGYQTISLSTHDFSGPAQDVATVTITAPFAGYVVVRFDGLAHVATSDRLTLAASDTSKDWKPNDGNVSLDQSGSFSHTRVYAVTPGAHTYYAVAQRYIGSGTGFASIYGTLTVEYFAKKF